MRSKKAGGILIKFWEAGISVCIKSEGSITPSFFSLKYPGHDLGVWWFLLLLGGGCGCGEGAGCRQSL